MYIHILSFLKTETNVLGVCFQLLPYVCFCCLLFGAHGRYSLLFLRLISRFIFIFFMLCSLIGNQGTRAWNAYDIIFIVVLEGGLASTARSRLR